jgi:hypothetical protein
MFSSERSWKKNAKTIAMSPRFTGQVASDDLPFKHVQASFNKIKTKTALYWQ